MIMTENYIRSETHQGIVTHAENPSFFILVLRGLGVGLYHLITWPLCMLLGVVITVVGGIFNLALGAVVLFLQLGLIAWIISKVFLMFVNVH